MSLSPRSLARRIGGVALALMLGGCGSSTTSPSSTPIPTRSRSVIGSFGFTLLSIPDAQASGTAFDFLGRDVTISPAGDLDAVVNWTFSSNNVNLYLTASACTAAQFQVASCSVLRSTESQGGKPKTLTSPALAAGTYTVWVVNFGNSGESGVVEVGVTR